MRRAALLGLALAVVLAAPALAQRGSGPHVTITSTISPTGVVLLHARGLAPRTEYRVDARLSGASTAICSTSARWLLRTDRRGRLLQSLRPAQTWCLGRYSLTVRWKRPIALRFVVSGEAQPSWLTGNVIGRVSLSPLCVVETPAPCEPIPAAADHEFALVVRGRGDGEQVRTRTRDGWFGFTLAPGDYELAPDLTEVGVVRASPVSFTVSAKHTQDAPLDLTIRIDTGIRTPAPG